MRSFAGGIFAVLLALCVAGCGSPAAQVEKTEQPKNPVEETAPPASGPKPEIVDDAKVQAYKEALVEVKGGHAIIDTIRYAARCLDTLYTMSPSEWIDHDLVWELYATPEDFPVIIDYLRCDIPDSERQVALCMLIKWPFLSGDVQTSYRCYQQLHDRFPESPLVALLKRDSERLTLAAEESKRLEALNIRPDEKLWRKGCLFCETLMVSWNEGEIYFSSIEFAHSFLKKLIKDYPGSAWADNAEFLLLKNAEGSIHEGGDVYLGCVDGYKAFLQKYPHSECRPEALMMIADHYRDFGMDLLEQKRPLAEAMAYFNEAKSRYWEIILTYGGTYFAYEAHYSLSNIQSFCD